jgi:prepilin-type N-terminal cleavage/methylation domain-containing protein
MKERKQGFTLIELLIVVAIIAILAAIAVPNFLEAQTRSKVSRVKSDLRTLATALEAYSVDYNNYPPDYGMYFYTYQLFMLSSPIAYVSSTNLKDPFTVEDKFLTSRSFSSTYLYVSYNSNWANGWTPNWKRRGAVMKSSGPNRQHDAIEHYPYLRQDPQRSFTYTEPNGYSPNFPAPAYVNMVYDPTNGTKSVGDIGYAVGDLDCSGFLEGQ